jgi:hypothetical protein
MELPNKITSYFHEGQDTLAVLWVKMSDSEGNNPLYVTSDTFSDIPEKFNVPCNARYDDLVLCIKQAKKSYHNTLKKNLQSKKQEIRLIKGQINHCEEELSLTKTKYFKNRYHDRGMLDYHDDNLDNDMPEIVNKIMKNNNLKEKKLAVIFLLDAASSLIHDYHLRCNFGDNNLGGGLTSREWLNQTITDDPVAESLRPSFKDFILSDIVPQEFTQEVLSAFYGSFY